MNYLHWDQQTIVDLSPENIAAMYARGYVFTRIGKGVMHQTRSVRIDLSRFELSSENRRVLRKTEGVDLSGVELPWPGYGFAVGKLAKDFYGSKFGDGTMSANKIKEMLTDKDRSNFNCLFMYARAGDARPIGYAICYTSKTIHHYSFPFYDIEAAPKDMGLGMMIKAIQFSKELGHAHCYLGSLQRPSDTYKLQFEGLEWFDGGPDGTGTWRSDLEAVKGALKKAGM